MLLGTMLNFDDFERKIGVVISGLFGSITASYSVALGVSVILPDRLTIVFAGAIVGIASSLANAASPLITRNNLLRSNVVIENVLQQLVFSFTLTFLLIFLPIIPYIVMENLNVARITSLSTGIVMLFIFGIHRAEVENRSNALGHAFSLAFLSGLVALVCFIVARYFVI